MIETNQKTLTRWFVEVWCHGNLDAIAELVDENTVFDGMYRDQKIEIADLPDMVTSLRSLVRSVRFNLLKCIEIDDWVAASYSFTIEALDTEREFDIAGQVLMRVKDGKIRESASCFDFFRLFEELGQLPSEALPICMTGQRLVWADGY